MNSQYNSNCDIGTSKSVPQTPSVRRYMITRSLAESHTPTWGWCTLDENWSNSLWRTSQCRWVRPESYRGFTIVIMQYFMQILPKVLLVRIFQNYNVPQLWCDDCYITSASIPVGLHRDI